MRYCPICQNVSEDDAARCSVCGRVLDPPESSVASSDSVDSSNAEPTPLPIWVTQKSDLPLDSLLEDDEPGDDSGADDNLSSQDEHSHSHDVAPDKDIFDEIAESVPLLYSNMSPKLRKFLLITLITTLLSIIPFVYTSCTHQENPLDSISQIVAPTIQNSGGAAVS